MTSSLSFLKNCYFYSSYLNLFSLSRASLFIFYSSRSYFYLLSLSCNCSSSCLWLFNRSSYYFNFFYSSSLYSIFSFFFCYSFSYISFFSFAFIYSKAFYYCSRFNFLMRYFSTASFSILPKISAFNSLIIYSLFFLVNFC
jgi:hypothetical protein